MTSSTDELLSKMKKKLPSNKQNWKKVPSLSDENCQLKTNNIRACQWLSSWRIQKETI